MTDESHKNVYTFSTTANSVLENTLQEKIPKEKKVIAKEMFVVTLFITVKLETT